MPGKVLYLEAANIIKEARVKKQSVKNLCYSNKYKRKRVLFALVLETLKHRKVLEKVLNLCGDIWGNLEIDENLKTVLLYDFLFGKGISTQNEYCSILNSNNDEIIAALEKVNLDHPELAKKRNTSVINIPRYVRVNTIKTNLDRVIEYFENEELKFKKDSQSDSKSGNEFVADKDISNLLIFPSQMDFHNNRLYKDGSIILQDKASCLPAYILNPPPGSIVMDACAAPGNKSTYLASIMNNSGKLYAFDLDKKRLELMKSLIEKSGAKCIQTKHQDFLKVKHTHPVYSDVQYILLDPSCSGSGIVSRMDQYVDDLEEKENPEELERRLDGLCRFQTAVLSHALGFPKVQKVIYSTCSIHKKENEDVIEKAHKRFSKVYDLIDILPNWKNRGIGTWEYATKCIRAVTESDQTNGFFVAMFQRKSSECFSTGDIELEKTENSFNGIENDKEEKKAYRKRKSKNKMNCITKLSDEPLNKSCSNDIFQSNPSKKKKKRNKPKKPVTL